MGVDIKGNFKGSPSYTTGCGLFAELRKNVAKAVLGDSIGIYTDWLSTDNDTPKEELHAHCKALYEAGGDALYNFVTQSDTGGKLTNIQCKKLYEKIKDSDLDFSLCYLFFHNDTTKKDFIKLLGLCVEHNCGLKWY